MKFSKGIIFPIFFAALSSVMFCVKNFQYKDTLVYVAVIAVLTCIFWISIFYLLMEFAIKNFTRERQEIIRRTVFTMISTIYLCNLISLYYTGNHFSLFYVTTVLSKNFLTVSGVSPHSYFLLLFVIFLFPVGVYLIMGRHWVIRGKTFRVNLPSNSAFLILMILLILERAVFVYGEYSQKNSIILAKSSLGLLRPGLPSRKIPIKILNSFDAPEIPDNSTGILPSNILVIMLESLRNDMFTEGSMPGLFFRPGHGFVNHISTSNGTHFSLFSALFGLYPEYYRSGTSTYSKPFLFEITEAVGYESLVINSRSYAWKRMNRFMNEKNIDVFDSTWHPEKPEYKRDSLVAEKYLTYLKKSGHPLTSFLTFNSTHLPYDFPNALKPPSYRMGNLDTLKTRYTKATEYIDGLLKNLFSRMEKINMYDSTLIVLFSDHGEEFGETGKIGHAMDLNLWQARSFLWIKLPGQEQRKMHLTPSSHVDILPTLLHAANIELQHERPMVGKALIGIGATKPRPILSFQASNGSPSKVSVYCRNKLINVLVNHFGDQCQKEVSMAQKYLWQ